MLTVEYLKENFGAFCVGLNGEATMGRILGEIKETDHTPNMIVFVVADFDSLSLGSLSDYKYDFLAYEKEIQEKKAKPNLYSRVIIWIFAENRGFVGYCDHLDDEAIWTDEQPLGYFAVDFRPDETPPIAEIYAGCSVEGDPSDGYGLSESLSYISNLLRINASKYGFGDLLFADSRHERMIGTLPASYHEQGGFLKHNYKNLIKNNKFTELVVHFSEYPNVSKIENEVLKLVKTIEDKKEQKKTFQTLYQPVNDFFDEYRKKYAKALQNATSEKELKKLIADTEQEFNETTKKNLETYVNN